MSGTNTFTYTLLLSIFILLSCIQAASLDHQSESDLQIIIDANNIQEPANYNAAITRKVSTYFVFAPERLSVSVLDGKHKKRKQPRCVMTDETSPLGIRKCTTEEEELRRDITETVLEHNFNFVMLQPRDAFNETDLIWVRVTLTQSETFDFPLDGFLQLKESQRINRFPLSVTHINQKDTFARNYKRLKSIHDNEFDFHPYTFLLPEDTESLLDDARDNPNSKWIAKPVYGGQGNGIKMVNSTGLLSKDVIPFGGQYLVQRYIPNPLLINGRKHTLRLYVLITSIDPLRVYVNKNGIAKFATGQFQESLDQFNDDNINMHITNQALNYRKPGYEVDAEATSVGHRWSLQGWRNYIKNNLSMDDDIIWENIKDVIIKSIISTESKLTPALHNYTNHRGICFQILGTDIDIDSNFKPWLIESNVNPTLGSKLKFERREKKEMLHSMLEMVIAGNLPELIEERKQIKEKILREFEVNDQDADYIAELEYEDKHKGSWERIFPVLETVDKYHNLFEEKRHSDQVVINWLKRN